MTYVLDAPERASSRGLGRKLRRAAALSVAVGAFGASAQAAQAAQVVNGSFETGTFAGWSKDDLGNGSWFINNGSATQAQRPTDGTFNTYTSQGGPGSHLLFQDVALEAGARHELTFSLGYQSNAPFATPDTLRHDQGTNQQFRMDVVTPNAVDKRSVAPADVLTRVFRTEQGTSQSRASATVTADLSQFAGRTVRLRFAEVDNRGTFFVSLDKVAITTRALDADGDGVVDDVDNCPQAANADQADLDGDRQGDACDPDVDGDGAANADDAFPRNAAESRDTDADGIGDNADAFPNDATEQFDTDADTVGDNRDNCRTVPNGSQADLDLDGQGDACDADIDGDLVGNAEDAFPRDAAESKDSDGDGVGDNGDAFPDDPTETTDTDRDSVGDNKDNCVLKANDDQADLDADGTGDACDPDVDGDGAANGDDAFPRDPAESKDSDGDGIGDNGDRFPLDANESADADDDGKGDRSDNCPTTANADQADLDRDGRGDACDADIDGDGVANDADNAPRKANADQADLDRDGVGDVIDPTVLPLTTDACKREGWKSYYDGAKRFKNQGDCVSYVSTGNRNLLAG